MSIFNWLNRRNTACDCEKLNAALSEEMRLITALRADRDAHIQRANRLAGKLIIARHELAMAEQAAIKKYLSRIGKAGRVKQLVQRAKEVK